MCNVTYYKCRAKMGVWHHAKHDALNVQIWALENEENIYFKKIGFECGFRFHIPNANTIFQCMLKWGHNGTICMDTTLGTNNMKIPLVHLDCVWWMEKWCAYCLDYHFPTKWRGLFFIVNYFMGMSTPCYVRAKTKLFACWWYPSRISSFQVCIWFIFWCFMIIVSLIFNIGNWWFLCIGECGKETISQYSYVHDMY